MSFTGESLTRSEKLVAKTHAGEVVQHWDDGTDETMEAHWKNARIRNGFDRSVCRKFRTMFFEVASYAFNKSPLLAMQLLVIQTAWIGTLSEFMAVLTSWVRRMGVHYVALAVMGQ